MLLFSFLTTIFFLTPALASPTPSNLNCDSLLSFDEASQHSIVSIRAFCNRRKHKTSLGKRSVTSVFDLPAVRMEQQPKSPRIPVPHYIAEEEHLDDPLIVSTPFEASKLHTPAASQGHKCHSTFPQRITRFFSHKVSSATGELRQRTHGLLVTIHGMMPNLVIAGIVAVSFVLLILLASERWLSARLRWTKSALALPPPPPYTVDEKAAVR